MSDLSEARSAQQQTTADRVRISMRGLPLLASGATMGLLGSIGNLWAHSKIYSSGGENALHSHAREDHMFFVLQGEAEFHFGDGSVFVARRHEGVMLPKGTYYRFVAVPAAGNLVMLRVGGAQRQDVDGPLGPRGLPAELSKGRLGSNGKYLDGDAKENGAHSQKVEFLEGEVFSPE